MLLVLRIINVVLLLALVTCIAGAIAGLIILAPFVAGAWFLNLMALLACERLEPAPNEAIPAVESGREIGPAPASHYVTS